MIHLVFMISCSKLVGLQHIFALTSLVQANQVTLFKKKTFILFSKPHPPHSVNYYCQKYVPMGNQKGRVAAKEQ